MVDNGLLGVASVPVTMSGSTSNGVDWCYMGDFSPTMFGTDW